MTNRRTALAFLACTLFAGPVLADPPAQQPAPAAQPAAAPPPTPEEVRANHRMQRLRAVGVDEPRARRAVQAMERVDAERKKLVEDVRTHRQALNKLLAAKSKDEQAYARSLVASRSAEKKLNDVRGRQTDALLKILKPSEVARFEQQRARAPQGKKQKGAKRKARGKKRS